MLSYQHIYHAGHAADIQKHSILLALLKEMQKKPSPLFMLDTHAGRGMYDLADPLAQKTAEFKTGIAKLCAKDKSSIPSCLHDFYDWAYPLYAQDIYDGTAMICAKMRRAEDSLHACEKHQGEYMHLKKAMQKISGVHCHLRDGYEGLKALIPPPQKFTRALVVMDPAYEDKKEFIKIAEVLRAQLQRYSKAVYVLWYPILSGLYDREMKTHMAAHVKADIYHVALIFKNITKGMKGTGMIVVNPPWQFEQMMKELNQAVADIVGEACEVQAEWLIQQKGEQHG